MSALIFGDSVLYTASKIAGTTVRLWVVNTLIARILAKEGKGNQPATSAEELTALSATLPFPLSRDVLQQTGASVAQVIETVSELRISYHHGFFAPLDLPYRYCITRDPLSRFISCISQKLGKKNFLAIRDTQDLIENFERLCLDPLARIPLAFSFNDRMEDWQSIIVPRHFAPQSYAFGEDPEYFTRIFNISEVNTSVRQLLSEHFEQDIPVQFSNRGKKTLPLTPAQVDAVRKIYKQDYNYGYC